MNPDYLPWTSLHPPLQPRTAAIIGAGIAGATVAYELAVAGIDVTVYDTLAYTAGGASGNVVGLMMPALTTDYSPFAEFYLTAFKYSIAHAKALNLKEEFLFKQTGIVQLGFNARQQHRQEKWRNIEVYQSELQYLSKECVSETTGVAFDCPGVCFKHAAYVSPVQFVAAHLNQPRINLRYETHVAKINKTRKGWQLYAEDNTIIDTHDVVIIANAHDVDELLPDLTLRLRKVRGQLSRINPCIPVKLPVAYEGYVTPEIAGYQYVGATFADGTDIGVTLADKQENLTQLQEALPINITDTESLADLSGDRAAIRCISTDYLPIIGPVPAMSYYQQEYGRLVQDRRAYKYKPAEYQMGLFVSLAHGSRGLISAPFAAKLLADELLGRDYQASSLIREHTHPAKFLIRDLKKGKLAYFPQ